MSDIEIGTQEAGFCANTANVWQVVGYVFLVAKIVIPILLIIWGTLDLGKAVIAAKDDEIKKATKTLAFRAVAAVVIFFIPTLVSFIIGVISDFSNSVKADWDVCRQCISKPGGDDCSDYARQVWEGEN